MNFLEELERVARAVETAEPKKQRFNPRPAGVIRPGRSSEMVLQALRDHGGAMSEGQLRFRTGLNHAKASWALIYLIRLGLVEAMPETHRSSRYQRYRIKAGGISDE